MEFTNEIWSVSHHAQNFALSSTVDRQDRNNQRLEICEYAQRNDPYDDPSSLHDEVKARICLDSYRGLITVDNPDEHWTVPLHEPLSDREHEILSCLAEGLSNREIAGKLHLSNGTVKWYNSQIYSKLRVDNRQAAIERATSLGLLTDAEVTPAVKHNIPSQTSAFIGRERELDELGQLLIDDQLRLITILAPGGMGKTRLALESARRWLSAFPDGVFFISLAPVSAVDHIIATIADDILEFHADGGQREQLLNYLHQRRLLLVLDNFEHLLSGVSIITEILRAAPHVKILVTSRERLNLSGEQVFKLGGMAFPEKDIPYLPRKYDAVEFFIQRARLAWRDFEVQTEDMPHLARICQVVGGMPLGMMLAAAWIEVLSLEEIAAAISSSPDVLTSQMRDLPERLHSIRTVFEHSWQQLSESDRESYAKLSVFRGGFTSDAARVVAGASVQTLRTLINRALVTSTAERRYEMHELLRQYAEDKLHSAGLESETRSIYAEFFVQLAEAAEPELQNGSEKWYGLLATEIDNLRAALGWALSEGEDAETGARILAPLTSFWFLEGHTEEAMGWINRVFIYLDQLSAHLQGLILNTAGFLSANCQETAAAQQMHQRALEIFRKADDQFYTSITLIQLGIAIQGGRADKEQYRELIALCDEGLEILRGLDKKTYLAMALNYVGILARDYDDLQRSRSAFEECLTYAQELGNARREANSLVNLGRICYLEGDFQQSKILHAKGLQLCIAIGYSYMLAASMATAAGPRLATGHAEKAARLLGASSGIMEATHLSHQPHVLGLLEQISTDTRAQLGDKTYEVLYEEGYRMSFDRAILYALSDEDEEHS